MRTIPDHGWDGLLPPYEGRDPTSRSNRSPYRASWAEIIERFATSLKRVEILLGLLRYRDALRNHGITNGFQWLTGSFVEEIRREPNDVDVVTFFHAPPGMTRTSARASGLFDPRQAKAHYHCDAYPIVLSYPSGEGPDSNSHAPALVDNTTYWYGLFSHRRDTYAWKGFLHLDLLPAAQDDAAKVEIERIKATLESRTP